MAAKRIVIGISGASGAVYGIRLLEWFKNNPGAGVETHLVITPSAEKTISLETGLSVDDVVKLAGVTHDYRNLAAAISSGTFITMGMVVIPCSMRTLSDIAYSRAENLLVRAADVTLKERRKLVIVPRETPLHKGHLELMAKASGIGAVILPPMPAFYHKPETVEDIVNHTVGKVLDQFEVEHELYKRWGE